MKSHMKKDTGVSPVIAVILMVAITVVLAGVVFLWAQSFTDDANSGVETIDVLGTIDDSADTLTIEVRSGTYEWDNYRLTVSNSTASVVVTTTAGTSTSAGGQVVFTDPATTANFFVGNNYNVKIVNIAADQVVWDNDIIAVA